MASCRLLLLITLFPFSVTAQESSNGNVTLGSSIVAKSNSTWTSPSGEFAFGFREVSPGAFLLAIWFDQLPDQTRFGPPTATSQSPLDQPSAFPQTERWSSSIKQTDGYGLVRPRQILNREGALYSSISPTNFSTGRFLFTLQADGDLVLTIQSYPLDLNGNTYWSSNTLETGFQLIFNDSGSIDLIRPNRTLFRPLFDSGPLAGQFNQRLVLEHDGVLRHYVYSSAAWSVRDFEPSNICRAVKEKHTGGGACGFNSYCIIKPDGRPSCGCPTGYKPRSGLTGCVPDFAQHRCDDARDAQSFIFDEMYNIDWPVVDYVNLRNINEASCRQSCLSDCFCAVAIYYNGNCFKKSLPFTNGRLDSGFDGKALIKVRMNNTLTWNLGNTYSGRVISKSSSTTLTVTLSALLGCSVLLFLLSSFFFVFYLNRTKSMVKSRRSRPAAVSTISSFNFKEVQEATNGFSEELGRGACSIVYRGSMQVPTPPDPTAFIH
ncbi:G-type lectin S-receptor-like serine/threonine-protein kinase LECRK3 [Salvia divinorum]|uniref:G-type lectin S-receptor-like serine/threonine-protein kinase LECRK3 n=1 Tax=Salvia divinorum TaxID=28513 RepID=A0ABD1HNQ4_SALDI